MLYGTKDLKRKGDKMRKISSLLTLLIAMFTFTFINVKATTREAYNIVTNPGENMSTSMQISYHSDVEGTFVEVTKYEDVDYLEKKVYYPEVVPWSRFEGEDPETKWASTGFYERYVCRVVLEDLEPNTKYRYRVGKTTFSDEYFFTTASGSGTFSFVHITDPQYSSSSASQIFNNLLSKVLEIEPNLAFGYFTGDVVDRGGRAELWELFFEKSNVKKIPFAMTTGNHEYYDNSSRPKMTSNDYFIHHYFHPQNGPYTETYSLVGSTYYFKYNNVLFISLDTESQVPVSQTTWFKEVVMNNPAQYIIVGMHRSFYGSQYESHSYNVRQAWQKTFEEYGVDLVLSGHDHIYARSHLLYQNNPTEDHTKGITYIIGGSGGNKFYRVKETAKKYYAKYVENTTVANIITVSEDNIAIKLIDLNGNILDTHTILPKRPTTIDENFSKDEFVNNIKFEQSTEDVRNVQLTWPNNGYGYVEKIVLNDGRLNYEAIISTPHRTVLEASLRVGQYYKLRVTVKFRDGDERTLEYNISTKLPYGEIKNVQITDIATDFAKLTWEAELQNQQIEKYQVLLDDEVIVILGNKDLSYEFYNLSSNTNYKVTLQAIDYYGDVVYEKTIQFTTLPEQNPNDNDENTKGCRGIFGLVFAIPLLGLGFITLKKHEDEE